MPKFDLEVLQRLRDVAEALVNPWPSGTPFDELSQARARAVVNAATRLQEIVRGAPSAAPTGRSRKESHRRRTTEADLAAITPAVEVRVGVTLDRLAALFLLDSVSGFGPQKFKAVHEQGVTPEEAITNPERVRLAGRTGEQLVAALSSLTAEQRELSRQRAARQLAVAAQHDARILTYDDTDYPSLIFRSSNPVPILYFRGDPRVFDGHRKVACVGSRDIREPYANLQRAFSEHVARTGWTVVSGFALGADSIAHRAAASVNGRTLAVMPGGLDRPFPPENRNLWEEFLQRESVGFISEFPFGTAASSMNLRKRNKLIAAAASGVLIGQSSTKGGAMNAFRFAIEQHKPVSTFSDDGTADTSGNRDIAEEKRVASRAFPLAPAPEEWDAWVSTLS